MIKKIFSNLFLLLLFLLITIILTLSFIGIETNRFNKLISNKISDTKNIELELKTINFKLDLKELSLFLETKNPKIIYKSVIIPTQSIKVYLDFVSLLKAELKIEKINLNLNELNITQIKKISKFIKPSNFKNFLNNKIEKGEISSEIEIFLNKEGKLKNYILKGAVKNIEIELFRDLRLTKTNLSFFADKEDILLKNIIGNIKNIKIDNGDVKFNLTDGIKISSNFGTKIDLSNKDLSKFSELLNKLNFNGKIKFINGNFDNNILINFDNTYKLQDYRYDLSGNINRGVFELDHPVKNIFAEREIKEIIFSDLQIDTSFFPKMFKLNSKGKYSLDNLNFLQFNLENISKNGLLNVDLNFDYKDNFELNLINYKKPKNTAANLSINLEKNKGNVNIKKFIFKEKDNFIGINGLKLKDNNFSSLKEIEVKTPNNNFFVKWDKKILIKGTKFDATQLPKILSSQSENNSLNQLNNNIEIDFKNIRTPVTEKLKNFRLIGVLQKGKFVKISSKGDFGGNNFLDISMKKDEKSDRRFLEVYSDLPRPLLSEYNFFKGLSGGKLLYTSLIDGSKSNSKLKIENFKVIDAPGLIKLLSIADLGGLADLAEGEGISFDVLEINMEKDKNFLKIDELIALGPSMSVLMEGYKDEKNLTSLKGTLVPAKTFNKLISKIPVLGNIVIPKEVGEGLFGVSFKMKGPKGKIKTSINPIRTITPRFIQKIVDKNKEAK